MNVFSRAVIVLFGFILPLAAHAQTKVRLGYTSVSSYMAAYVAKEQGIFARNGLDVELQAVAGGALVPGLQGGSLEMIGIPPTNVILAVISGLDMVYVAGTAVTQKSDQDFGILIGKNSGISSAKELEGKKVSVPSVGGFLHVMALKWLVNQGVDPKKVGFVEANFAQTPDMLSRGTIQGAVSAAPFLNRAVESGASTVLAYLAADLPAKTSGSYYTTTGKWAQANPAAVRAFRQSIMEAIAFVEKNPAQAKSDMAKYVKLPPEVLATLKMPNLDGSVTTEQVSFWVNTLYELGLATSKPEVSRLIAK